MISDCKLISLNNLETKEMNLLRIETLKDIEFKISRIFYMYGMDKGLERGNHAHKEGYQLIVAACGHFSVIIDDAIQQKKFDLSTKSEGLLVGPGIWRVLKDFSHDAVCLVFNSEKYDETNTLRSYSEFLEFIK